MLVLTNSVNHNQQWEVLKRLEDEIMAKKLMKSKYSAENLAWKTIIAENKKLPVYQPPDPNTFTPYNPEWEKYTGTYHPLIDWKLRLGPCIGFMLGTFSWGNYSVYEGKGYLNINGQRLDEYQPGVFFTKDGDCLDFSGPLPLWNGLRIKKR